MASIAVLFLSEFRVFEVPNAKNKRYNTRFLFIVKMFPAAWLVVSTLRLPHSVDSLANLPIIIEVAKLFL